ncbi:MAG: NAD-dependent epimerase/dehydratase family protein [Flavobacteriaceae bacterium]
MNNSKVLITGGAGFVGSNLSHYLLANFDIKEIIIVDNLISAEMINVPKVKNVTFIYGSIAEDSILDQLPEDLNYVFHLSCFHGNQSSIANPIEDHKNNNLTSLKLFNKISKFNKLEKVVYAAAGCAVAEKKYGVVGPTSEDAPVSLFHDSPYSISKLVGEMYGNFYFQQEKMPFVKARFQNIYGPREILGAGVWRGTVHTVFRNVTPTFIWKTLHNEEITLYAEGAASRDFLFVEDVVRGLVACATMGDDGEAYNLASGVETTIKQLAETIISLTDSKSPINLMPKRDWDNSGNRFGDPTKSRVKLGFTSNIDLAKGLQKTIEWTLTNKKFIEQCIQKHNYYLI